MESAGEARPGIWIATTECRGEESSVSTSTTPHTLSCTNLDLALVTTREEGSTLCRTVSVMSGVEARQGGACLPPLKYKHENHTFWYHVSLLGSGYRYCGLLPVGRLLSLFIML